MVGGFSLAQGIADQCGILGDSLVQRLEVARQVLVDGRSLQAPVTVRTCVSLADLALYSQATRTILVDRETIGYAVALADATRHPSKYGLAELESLIEFGSSPRGPIGLVQAGRALALLRGRGHVAAEDIRDLALDVLRHRVVLSYDALSEGITADRMLEQVLGAVNEPSARSLTRPRHPQAAAAPDVRAI